MLFYCTNNPDTTLFDGKGLIMGGSHQLSRFDSSESYFGDLSAVMMQNLPFWAHFFRTPDLSIAIMDNWDEKVEKMALATLEEDVTSISGVPTWTLVLFDKLFEPCWRITNGCSVINEHRRRVQILPPNPQGL